MTQEVGVQAAGGDASAPAEEVRARVEGDEAPVDEQRGADVEAEPERRRTAGPRRRGPGAGDDEGRCRRHVHVGDTAVTRRPPRRCPRLCRHVALVR